MFVGKLLELSDNTGRSVAERGREYKKLHLHDLCLVKLSLFDEGSHVVEKDLCHAFVGHLFPCLALEQVSEYADHIH